MNIADSQGFLPIHQASAVPCARALLAHGADVLSRNAWGRTPLHQACERDVDVELLELFMSAGADVNATDDAGETALHAVIVHESINHLGNEHATRLLQAGADSNINLSGDSPLRFAIMFNTHEILKELLNHPTDFHDCKHLCNHTFAHSIARTADVETLQILEGAGDIVLDLDALDKSGKTALDYVRERSQDPTLAAAFDRFARAVTSPASTTSAQQDSKTQYIGKSVGVGALTAEPTVSTIELNDSEDEEGNVDDSSGVTYHDAVEDFSTLLPSAGRLETAAA